MVWDKYILNVISLHSFNKLKKEPAHLERGMQDGILFFKFGHKLSREIGT